MSMRVFLQNPKMPKARRYRNSPDSSVESSEENNLTNDVEDTSDSSISLSTSEEATSSIQCEWILGQLAWARVGNFPFWPCVITLDPVLMTYYRLKGKPFRKLRGTILQGYIPLSS